MKFKFLEVLFIAQIGTVFHYNVISGVYLYFKSRGWAK